MEAPPLLRYRKRGVEATKSTSGNHLTAISSHGSRLAAMKGILTFRYQGVLMNLKNRRIHPPKPAKPADKIQNVQTVRPLGKTVWVLAHWRYNYVPRKYEWIQGHWNE
jgi:hypothetical protein